MRRKINDYKLYVFDLDGTLYDQPGLRLQMLTRLMGFYILHPFRAGELFILQHFRKVKDSWTKNSSEDDIIKQVAADKKTDEARVKSIVRRWIYDDPLEVIAKNKDTGLIGWMDLLRKSGKKVFILSDYPAADKLKAMNVTVDGIYDPDDERIDELKPSPKGLNVIMGDTGILPEDILMIGDRMEKDGLCAEKAGIDHMILPRKITDRNHEKLKC